jgi:hypothetical protein
MTGFYWGPGLLDSADSDVFVQVRAHVHRFVNVFLSSDRARSTSQRLLYRGVRSEWYRVLLSVWVCDGQWQGLVPALGPGVHRSGPSPESLSAAKRFDTTSGDVDVSLATFAVLRLSPG